MKEYKLQEEELAASFKPNDPAQYSNYPPQGLYSPYHIQHYPQPALPSRVPVPNMPPNQYMRPQPPYPVSQPEYPNQQRTMGPPVVFNYNEHQNPQGFFQRESIVQSVGAPGRQFDPLPNQIPEVQRQVPQMPPAPQPTPTSTPQQLSRGTSNPQPLQQQVIQNNV
jgi:hypothetical protein